MGIKSHDAMELQAAVYILKAYSRLQKKSNGELD